MIRVKSTRNERDLLYEVQLTHEDFSRAMESMEPSERIVLEKYILGSPHEVLSVLSIISGRLEWLERNNGPAST